MPNATASEAQSEDAWARRDVRRERFDSLGHLWSLTQLARVRACRRTRISIEAGVSVVRSEDHSSHMQGLQSCTSVHSCPVCAPAIRKVRADEIEQAADRHMGAGGGLLFLTLTLPHTWGDDLAPLLQLVRDGYQFVVSGRRWAADRADFGIDGTIRSLEVTLGQNGWHPHLHVLLFTDTPLSEDAVERLRDRLHGRWVTAIERTGRKAPSDAHGTRLLACATHRDVARYLSKVYDENGYGRHIGNELARHDLKQGRRAGRNPFQLLEDTRTGEASDLARWWEYEAGMKGQRAIAWSKGLKARFGIGDVEDEEVLEVAPAADPERVDITDTAWRSLRKVAARMIPALLTAHELHGTAGAHEVLDAVVARDSGPDSDARATLNLQSDPIPLR